MLVSRTPYACCTVLCAPHCGRIQYECYLTPVICALCSALESINGQDHQGAVQYMTNFEVKCHKTYCRGGLATCKLVYMPIGFRFVDLTMAVQSTFHHGRSFTSLQLRMCLTKTWLKNWCISSIMGDGVLFYSCSSPERSPVLNYVPNSNLLCRKAYKCFLNDVLQ